MVKPIDVQIVEEARRLRIEDRLSLMEIASHLGIAKSSASVMLRDVPLSPEELRARRVKNAGVARKSRLGKTAADVLARKTTPRFSVDIYRSLSTDQKGSLAEAACIFRMKQHGIIPYLPLVQGGKVDLVAYVPVTERFFRVQVKTARPALKGRGRSSVPLRARQGRTMKRYNENAFDFLVAYEAPTEICYVIGSGELQGKTSVLSVSDSMAEAWHKMLL